MLQTHEHLKEIVLPYLQSYKGDLLIHDYYALLDYDGAFLYGYRSSGTNLILMDAKIKSHVFKDTPDTDTEPIIRSMIQQIIYPNDHFLYFDGTFFSAITQQKAEELWTAYCDKLYSKQLVY